MSYHGFYDLCINFDGTDVEKLHRLLSRLYEMGYRTVAINQTIDESVLESEKKKKKKGEKSEKSENSDTAKLAVDPIDIESIKNEFKDKLCILSRLTFTFSDSARTYTLAQLPALKKFDLYGVVPKNQAALQFACSQLSTDIVTIKPSGDGLKFSRKLYLQAVERGVHFEIQYANAINESTRKMAIHHSHLFHVYGKSRNVIISSGASDYAMIRNPYDVVTLGALFGLNEVKAKAAILSQCNHLLLRAEGRRFGKAIFAIEITDKPPESSEEESEDVESSEDELPPLTKKIKTVI